VMILLWYSMFCQQNHFLSAATVLDCLPSRGSFGRKESGTVVPCCAAMLQIFVSLIKQDTA
jgi:hypothetical protein